MTAPPIQLPEPSQANLRAARALQRRAQRAETGMFLVEGRQAVREALATPGVVEEVYFRWDAVMANQDLLDAAKAAGVPYYAVSEQNLATITDTVTPQGVVAVANAIDVPLETALSKQGKSQRQPEPMTSNLARMVGPRRLPPSGRCATRATPAPSSAAPTPSAPTR